VKLVFTANSSPLAMESRENLTCFQQHSYNLPWFHGLAHALLIVRVSENIGGSVRNRRRAGAGVLAVLGEGCRAPATRH